MLAIPVVGPEDHVRVDDLTVPLPGRAASLQAAGLEVVVPEDLDPALDGEVVQLVGHLQKPEVDLNGKIFPCYQKNIL